MTSMVEGGQVFNKAGAGVLEDGVERSLGDLPVSSPRHQEMISNLYSTGSAAVMLDDKL